jgi:phosphotransferase system IIA component
MKKLLFICMLTISTSLFAQSIATVIFTARTVNLERGDKKTKIERGDKLQVGDMLITTDDSYARIKYLNGTLVTVGSGSKYKILAYSPDKDDITIKAELKHGKIDSTTSGKKKEILKTPMVTLAIIGTEYKTFVSCVDSEALSNPCAGGIANCTAFNVNVIVTQGKVKIGDKVLEVGIAYLITPKGISEKPFPKEGSISPDNP